MSAREFLLLLFVIFLAAVTLSGCAAVQTREIPECPTAEGFYAQTPAGPAVAFTLDQFQVLRQQIEARARGECK